MNLTSFFMDEETKTQRGQDTCPRSHSKSLLESGTELLWFLKNVLESWKGHQ